MGKALSGMGGDFHFNNTSWLYVLGLARQHGWEPAGTELPHTVYNADGTVNEELTRHFQEAGEDWDGGYFTNDCQLVTDEDANNIAEALERALDLIPDEETVGMQAASREIRDSGNVQIGGVSFSMLQYLTASDWFSGAPKQRVRDFISFCRAGGFNIV